MGDRLGTHSSADLAQIPNLLQGMWIVSNQGTSTVGSMPCCCPSWVEPFEATAVTLKIPVCSKKEAFLKSQSLLGEATFDKVTRRHLNWKYAIMNRLTHKQSFGWAEECQITRSWNCFVFNVNSGLLLQCLYVCFWYWWFFSTGKQVSLTSRVQCANKLTMKQLNLTQLTIRSILIKLTS